MKKHLTLLGVAAMATAVLAGCSNDEILESYQGEEISFKTRIETRATELTKANLGNFYVIAKGMHPKGDIYDVYLVGNETNGVVEGDIAKQDKETSNTWVLDHDVYWPSEMKHIAFWAYTTNKDSDPSDQILSSGTVKFDKNNGGPKIEGFIPERADLNSISDAGYWNDGDSQKDLLTAYTVHDKDKTTVVPLNFKHALSQIDIKAVQKDKAGNDHRIVKIKGAWIVNVNTKGDLTAGFKWDATAGTAEENIKWVPSEPGHYGSFSSAPYELDTEAKSILGTNNNGSLMIIPQEVNAWDSNNNNTGAYILLLCRVELKHKGSTHDGVEYPGEDIDVDDAGNHYHQLFPVNVNNIYDKTEYGFTCVPLDTKWEMGKKYTYILDICGETSGAGIYPPDFNNDMLADLIPESVKDIIKIVQRPNTIGKDVGAKVLDEPIRFSVTIEDWKDAKDEGFNDDVPML